MEEKTLEYYIKRGKELIADWQFARVCMDRILMDKYCRERQEMEREIMSKGDDFYYDYYMGINS